MDNNIIISELKKLIDTAIMEDEVPIASLIVENDKIIGKGYNKVESTQNFMNHAEVIAINAAMKYKNNWRLNNCILYTTLEPCSMCKEIIKKSRIQKVIYFSKKTNDINNIVPIFEYKKIDFFSEVLSQFFIDKRNK